MQALRKLDTCSARKGFLKFMMDRSPQALNAVLDKTRSSTHSTTEATDIGRILLKSEITPVQEAVKSLQQVDDSLLDIWS